MNIKVGIALRGASNREYTMSRSVAYQFALLAASDCNVVAMQHADGVTETVMLAHVVGFSLAATKRDETVTAVSDAPQSLFPPDTTPDVPF